MRYSTRGGSRPDPRDRPRTGPEPSERRDAPRYTVLDHRGWLGLWGDEGFEVVEVHLLDLSRGGAAFETSAALAEHQTVLLGLEDLRDAWCHEATVVRVARGRRQRYRVHAAFAGPCQDDFYAAALDGPRRDAAGTGISPG